MSQYGRRTHMSHAGQQSKEEPHWAEPWVLLLVDMIPWFWVLIQIDEVALGQSIWSEWTFAILSFVVIGVSKWIKWYLVTHVYER